MEILKKLLNSIGIFYSMKIIVEFKKFNCFLLKYFCLFGYKYSSGPISPRLCKKMFQNVALSILRMHCKKKLSLNIKLAESPIDLQRTKFGPQSPQLVYQSPSLGSSIPQLGSQNPSFKDQNRVSKVTKLTPKAISKKKKLCT